MTTRQRHQQTPSLAPPTSASPSDWSPSQLLSATYKDLGSPQVVGQKFKDYLLNSDKCLASLINILFVETGKTGVHDYSLQVDMHNFLASDPVLGNMLLRHPSTLLPLLEDAIVNAQKDILKRVTQMDEITNTRTGTDGNGNGNGNNDKHSYSYINQQTNIHRKNKAKATLKGVDGTRVHARLIHLPPHSSNFKPSLSTLSSHDVGKILQISGTVVRTSKIQMYESQRAFQCDEKKGCGARFVVKADLQQWNNALVSPARCPTQGCKCKNFKVIDDPAVRNSNRSDYQEIKVQESIGKGGGRVGVIPKALLIKLQHDLVDKCQPGDDVVIVGTLISHWQNLVMLGDINIGMAIHAHSVRTMHGGEGGTDGSSWDCIFDQDNANTDESDNSGVGMVKEEIVREFDNYWKQDENILRPIAARNRIVQGICPALYGISLVKLALLLTLIGGSSNAGKGGNHQSEEGGGDDPINLGDEDDNNKMETADRPLQFNLSDDDESASMPNSSPGDTNGSRKSTQKNYKKDSSKGKTVQTRRREQSHLLLVGDPGCGKSQVLRFAAALCPRSVLTSGSGTTSAGLTCAAVRDDTSKDWTLEAGALVLADRGVCAIDEFSCIAGKDRTVIHEAMEQQTLSVAKAGIVCKLNCRATVIAVCNAKGGYYNPDKSFSINVGIEPPLLSRFDLIFKLIDGSDAIKDDNVANFLLNRAIQGAGYECTRSSNSNLNSWNIDKLRAYIATVKSRFHPTITSDASVLLRRHYYECRNSEYIEVQVTVRLLESLIRLAQAHARLMHRTIVNLDDAVAIILLMECTAASTSMSSFNTLYTDPTTYVFPGNGFADVEFILQKRKVLDKYEMLDRLTANEVRVIEDQNLMSQNNFNVQSWDNMEPNDAVIFSTTETDDSWNAEQDLYGRLTQKTTPSPSFRHTREDIGNDFGSRDRKKRRRNHSAD